MRGLMLGTFDLVHAGHIRLFKLARELCDVVIVGLNTDAFVVQYKGKLPAMQLEERMEIVKACKYVDRVEVNEGGYNSRMIIERVRPDVIFHGTDWMGESFMKQLGVTKDWLLGMGITLIYVDYQTGFEPISSTIIKQKCKNQ
jgi:cytidyltransferase-like protein